MFGVNFYTAGRSLIVVTAEFEVESREGPSKFYKYVGGPYKTRLQEMQDNGDWVTIAEHNVEAEIESILPNDFGMEWTWCEFLIALTFWADGNKRGYYKGLYTEKEY